MPNFSVPNQINAGDPLDATKAMANWNQVVNDLNAAKVDNTNIAAAAGILADQLADASKLGISGASTVRRGATIVATSESRTNVAYGLLTTPDRVSSVVVPANAIVRLYYQATWQESVAGAARAAIFVGANQLQVAVKSGATNTAAPATQAGATGGGTVAKDSPLTSGPGGLYSAPGMPTAYTSDPTTGTALGLVVGVTDSFIAEIGGTVISFSNPGAGAFAGVVGDGVVIDNLAAGTYDFTVQFKATSGTVTVKNRRLKVIVEGF